MTGCVKTSFLANPTRSESATGENSFQLLEDELKSCTRLLVTVLILFVVRRPKNVTDRSAFVTDKFELRLAGLNNDKKINIGIYI